MDMQKILEYRNSRNRFCHVNTNAFAEVVAGIAGLQIFFYIHVYAPQNQFRFILHTLPQKVKWETKPNFPKVFLSVPIFFQHRVTEYRYRRRSRASAADLL